MSGPVARKYKKGSIIYFEGDISDEIFILKGGKVILISLIVETGMETSEELKPGEFFGVKSSLGHFPREETAQTLTDAEVLVMKPAEFELLMSKNFRLVMKMLKVFSNQLRSVGKRVRDILGDTDLKIPSTELLKLAEYYYEHNKLDYARFVYEKFLKLYPESRFRDRAELMLKSLEMKQPFPGKFQALYQADTDESAKIETPIPDYPAATKKSSNNLLDDSFGGISKPAPGAPITVLDTPQANVALESSEIDFQF